MIATSHYRSTRPGLADLLQYAAVVAPGVVLNKNGSITAGFYYRGSDLASSTYNEVADVSARINEAIKRLGSGWVIHCDAVRINSLGYPQPSQNHFPDKVSRWIDDERRAQFQRLHSHYESIYALLITYLPPLRTHSKAAEMMYEDHRPKGRLDRNAIANRTLDAFEHKLEELQDSLGQVLDIERMLPEETVDEFGAKHVNEHILQYLHFAITGENHPINLPVIPMYLDAVIASEELFGGVTPKIGEKFIAVVGIDGFPQNSYPRILAALDELPFPYRWSSRFIMLDAHEAETEMKKYRRKWAQKVRGFIDQVFQTGKGVINQDAQSKVAEIDEAIGLVNNGAVLFGYYTSNIIILGTNRETLDEQSREVRKVIQSMGFPARVESINALEAWLGTLPAHVHENVRRPLINTLNFADLLPLSSIWPGREHNPCPMYPSNSPALFHAATDGHTPFRFNMHVGDLGHTLIFGPPGSGKSVLLAFMASSFLRFKNARVYAFDKGRSLYALCEATGGTHYDVASDLNGGGPAFCPLNEIDTDSDLSWAETWIGTLVELQKVRLLPVHRNAIHRAMLLHRNSPKGERDLTRFLSNLQDKELREALEYYTLSGCMGKLVDSAKDDLQDSRFQTFEIEELMNMGNENALPVLLYLFRCIEKSLDGSPTVIFIDEAWMVLGHPVFAAKVREWLKVLRKANCCVVLATQSLSDAAKSGIMDVLIEACPTKLYLPNPDAMQEDASALYRSMRLNDRQIQLLAEATKKRDYYFSSPEGRRMFRLNLGRIALAFTATSGKETLAKIRNLCAQHGEEWPEAWLKENNIEIPINENN